MFAFSRLPSHWFVLEQQLWSAQLLGSTRAFSLTVLSVFNKGQLSLFFGFYLSVLMKLDLFDGATLAVLARAPACDFHC